MRNIFTALSLVLALGGLALNAESALAPKTLTSEFYTSPVHGKSKKGGVLIAPAYNRSLGVSWDGRINWMVPSRVNEITTARGTVLKSLFVLTGNIG